MPLTRNFKETVVARARQDSAFRLGLLQSAVDALLDGELAVGKSLLRTYINATVGFQALGTALAKDPKSLMRMLGERGNPRAESLFGIISHLQSREGVSLHVQADRNDISTAAS